MELSDTFKKSLKTLNDDINQLVKAAKGGRDDGWIDVSTKNNVHITKRHVEGSPLCCFRGAGPIKTTVATIHDVHKTLINIKKWDKMLMDCTEYESYESEEFSAGIYWMKFASPGGGWVIANRDFCVLGALKYIDNGRSLVCFTQSIEYPKCPPVQGFVRGELKATGSLVETVDDQNVAVTYVVQLDPKGWIPPWMSNTVGDEQPLNVAAMRKYFEEVHPKEKTKDSR